MSMKLFVGNLSARVTEEALRVLFSRQGEISEIKLTVERSAGRSRAFAIVTMATPEGAKAALESLHRHIWNGRYITVNEIHEESPAPCVPRWISSPSEQAVSPFFPIRTRSGG